jgi:hypothetical protein
MAARRSALQRKVIGAVSASAVLIFIVMILSRTTAHGL